VALIFTLGNRSSPGATHQTAKFGTLTSLALVHTLGPVERFATARKVTAYVGLDPLEHSSGERQRIGSISKQGSKLLRYLMVEAGHTASRHDPDLKRFYYRALQGNLGLRKGWEQ
jgi:transposase